jgi:hypothetical protein
MLHAALLHLSIGVFLNTILIKFVSEKVTLVNQLRIKLMNWFIVALLFIYKFTFIFNVIQLIF